MPEMILASVPAARADADSMRWVDQNSKAPPRANCSADRNYFGFAALLLGTGSVFAALHLANFFVVMSRHFVAGGAVSQRDCFTNLPLSRHLPASSSAGFAWATPPRRLVTASKSAIRVIGRMMFLPCGSAPVGATRRIIRARCSL
jgi:hypothetical protein